MLSAREVIEQGDERNMVDYAIEVSRSLLAMTRELDEVKRHLRQQARDRIGLGQESVEIAGNLGVAVVVVSGRSKVTARKGRDIKDLEINLSQATFRSLFVRTVEVSPVSDFLERLRGLVAADRAVIEEFLEISLETPKVYLPK